MKKAYVVFIVFLALPLLSGMGSINGMTASDNIPVPEKKFSGIFVDEADVITECSQISIAGHTFVQGKRGEGTYSVPFENIDGILFFQKEGTLTAEVLLKDKEKVILALKKDQKAYGKTAYGTFQIELENLKKLTVKRAGS